MRKLAIIQKIEDIQPIEGADRIERVRVKDWWCVTNKGTFQVNDLCVYFEIDSLLPISNPAFEFMAKGNSVRTMKIDGKEYKGYRLKTIRLRKQISQGLALPISTCFNGQIISPPFELGDDASMMLDVVKWEPPIPAELRGKVKGNFPGFLRKTDEERIQNCGDILTRYAGERCYIASKLDGTSVTFYKKDGVFGVCSRNLELLDSPENTYWNIARAENLAEKLPEGYCIQGEIVGEGIQNNPLRLTGQQLYVFNVFFISTGIYLDYVPFREFCDNIKVRVVPVISEDFLLGGTVEDLLKMASAKSPLNPTAWQEGIVIRPLNERIIEIAGQQGRFSFKAISNDYLLKELE